MTEEIYERIRKYDAETMAKVIADFVDNSVLKPYPKQVVVSPIVTVPPNFKDWQFGVAAGADGGEPHIDGITSPDKDYVEVAYALVLVRLGISRPALVIHVTGSELQAVQLCSIIWPTKKMKELYQAVKKEEAERGGT